MKKIVITGANGFLGSALCKHFIEQGWQVTALVHHLPNNKIEGVSYAEYDLSSPPDRAIMEGADCFIHCAYAKVAKGVDALATNIEGTKKLLAVSRSCGVKKNIFISSLAAREDALSVYGKQKFEIEKLFNQPGDLILRPGLILGNGGLFGQMRDYLKKSRFIPLISGGKQPMQVIHINDAAKAIEMCIQKEFTGTLAIATLEKMDTKEFYTMLCESLNVKPVFVSLPYSLLYLGLTFSETLGIHLAISRENLLGLKKITYTDTSADLAKIGITLKSCENALHSIA